MYKADIGRYVQKKIAHSHVWVGKAPVTQWQIDHNAKALKMRHTCSNAELAL